MFAVYVALNLQTKLLVYAHHVTQIMPYYHHYTNLNFLV
jgi:hypothetical protein